MGALTKAFKSRSSMSAKKDGVWQEIIERLQECDTVLAVVEFERWVETSHWNLPHPYKEPLADAIEDRLESIAIDEEILAGRMTFR